jgi:hypothetical protein
MYSKLTISFFGSFLFLKKNMEFENDNDKNNKKKKKNQLKLI